ncbi:alpha-ketoacid dehydrogenase subunit beta [bacterium]|nr:alpha-ketoacid dehydrogenase subunit beta [bacterium]
MAKLTMVQAINLALRQEMKNDETVVMLGEDVGRDGGVFRVTEGLWDEFGEARVIDTPLAESGILATAIGMAIGGLKPVAEMQFSGFSYIMLHQLEMHASRFRTRTQGWLTCPLVVRMPYGAGVRALEHHSESREHLYSAVTGCKIVLPSSPRNARALMVAAIRDPDPVVFMEPKRSYRSFREEVPDEEEVLPLCQARVVREGGDITVVGWGAMMPVVLEAVDGLREKRGVNAEVIDVLTVSPLDSDTIVESVKKTGRCVIVQEAPRSYSISSEIVARLNDEALLYLEAPVKRLTGYDIVTPYFGRENDFIHTPARVVKAIEETLDF